MTANEHKISLMVIGNFIVDIPRTDIVQIENETKSLMYENLLDGLNEEEKESLLDFMVSLSQ